ncbi:hypothetical protein TIFTF001_056325, partial [Ficus carica]
MENRGSHFVLVHGTCHGAWCWYKVAAQLKSTGHKVTALDLATSGIHPNMGGVCISLAMERFPRKISVAVFATAFMP